MFVLMVEQPKKKYSRKKFKYTPKYSKKKLNYPSSELLFDCLCNSQRQMVLTWIGNHLVK